MGSVDSVIQSSSLDIAEFYIQQKVEGVFLAPFELMQNGRDLTRAIVEHLKAQNIQVVLIDSAYELFPKSSGIDLVSIDNFRAGYTLSMHYLEKQEKRVDFIMPRFPGETVKLRHRGFYSALIDHGIQPSPEWSHVYEESDNLGRRLKKNGVRNIICSNDWIALKLMKQLQHQGFQIPEDFRIAGFDNSMFAQTCTPGLTSIDQPCDILARTAVEIMIKRLSDPDSVPIQYYSDFTLYIRDSTS